MIYSKKNVPKVQRLNLPKITIIFVKYALRRFGCLSTRLFYYQLTELYRRVKRVHPPLSLHGQVLWREFFYCAATRNPNFDRMVGNPICVQIPWEKNPEALAKWATGHTGFPWIDAIMIQLRDEGWIHHQARHAVACFLTRGDLWISWEEGMKVFDELMLDADWSVNAGTWMWMSCSSFFQQFFHSYCPVGFGRKMDPNGDYIRRFLPILKNLPTRYVHEPWLAPEHVQRSARCIIGRDYPLPIVDHASVAEINIERIKQVYSQLAKYSPLPYYTFIPYMQRPTSIIQSIHQSDYLCSQASEVPQAKFKTPIPINSVSTKQLEPVPNHNALDPKARPIIDHTEPPSPMMNQLYSGVFDEPNEYQDEFLNSPNSFQYDFKNLDLNNDLNHHNIEQQQDNTPKDVFIQPMYYVPYDDARLGLQPMYAPLVEPQHTIFPTHIPANTCPPHMIQPANTFSPHMIQQPVNTLPPHMVQPANTFPTPMIPPANTYPPHLISSANTYPPQMIQPANTCPPHMIPPANTPPPHMIQPANTFPPHMIPPANACPPHIIPSANNCHPDMMASANNCPPHMIPPANTFPTHMIQSANTFPTHMMQSANTCPTHMIQPTNTFATQMMQPAHIIQPANTWLGYMPTTYTQQEITTVGVEEQIRDTYLPICPTVPTDLNCQILEQNDV